MIPGESMEERRIAERFKLEDNCIVVHPNKVGNIQNISSSGLYCTCFQDSTCEKGTHQEIDILCGNGKYLVKGLKVKIVDTETKEGKFLKNFEIKTCRMQFVEVEEVQASNIETIIEDASIQQ